LPNPGCLLPNAVQHSKRASHAVCAKKHREYVDEIDPNGVDGALLFSLSHQR